MHGEAAVSAAPTLDGTLHVPMIGLLSALEPSQRPQDKSACGAGCLVDRRRADSEISDVCGLPAPRHALTAPFVLTALSLHTCFTFTITRLILLGGGECGVSFVYGKTVLQRTS